MPFGRLAVVGTALVLAASAAVAGEKVVIRPIYIFNDGPIDDGGVVYRDSISYLQRLRETSHVDSANRSADSMPVAVSANGEATDLVALRARLLEEKRRRGLE